MDAICDVGAAKIEESMGFDQVNIYAYGKVATRPCNSWGWFLYLLAAIIVIGIIYTIFLVAYLLDNSMHTAEDVSKYLKISLLAEIPNCDKNANKKSRKYRYSKYYTYRYSPSNSKTNKQSLRNKEKGTDANESN